MDRNSTNFGEEDLEDETIDYISRTIKLQTRDFSSRSPAEPCLYYPYDIFIHLLIFVWTSCDRTGCYIRGSSTGKYLGALQKS